MSSKFLSKKDILSVDDLQVVEKYIEEWNGTVRISEMSADVRDKFEQYMGEISRKLENQEQKYFIIRAPLCAMCMVDEKSNQLFTIEEVEKLGRKNGRVLNKIFDEANKLNKVFGDQREGVTKNSETTQAGSDGGE